LRQHVLERLARLHTYLLAAEKRRAEIEALSERIRQLGQRVVTHGGLLLRETTGEQSNPAPLRGRGKVTYGILELSDVQRDRQMPDMRRHGHRGYNGARLP
jgi:hypothetical protein